MAQTLSKSLSALISIGYLVAAGFGGGAEAVLIVSLYLLLPLACIWFSEEMGDYTGIIRWHLVTSPSPGWLVAAGGWLLLLLPVIVGLIWHLQGHNP